MKRIGQVAVGLTMFAVVAAFIGAAVACAYYPHNNQVLERQKLFWMAAIAVMTFILGTLTGVLISAKVSYKHTG